MTPDYYDILHVPREATQQQISRAYRALMRSHHPDMEGGSAHAISSDAGGDARASLPEGELLRIMQAFGVLRDPARRAAYDRETRGRASPATPAARDIPVRKVHHSASPSGNTIRVTPVRWESGPWA